MENSVYLWQIASPETFNILNVFTTFQSIPFCLLNLVFCLEKLSLPYDYKNIIL